MRARVDDEGSTYAAARTIRHARAVSLRNLRLRGGCGGGGFEKINADATLYGDRTTTRCVIRPYRSSGAVYAPTPYGEVCVDDDSEDSKWARAEATTERARGGRARNPDFNPFTRDSWVARGGTAEARENALRGAMSGTKLELVVYESYERNVEAEAHAVEETRPDASERSWRRGRGVVTSTSRNTNSKTSRGCADLIVCRAAIDLRRLVCVGERVPSGLSMPPNAIFLRMSDGYVYVPEPVANGEIRDFLNAVEERSLKVERGALGHRRNRSARWSSFGGSESGTTYADALEESWDASPRALAAITRASGQSGSPRHAVMPAMTVKLDVRAMVAKIERLIEADRSLKDAMELRDELARRLGVHLSGFKDVRAIWEHSKAASHEKSRGSGTTDERITALTIELVAERERLRVAKEDVGRRVRALRQAGERLVEANSRLNEADQTLSGPEGVGKLYQKQRALGARRWRLVGELAEIFPIERANVAEAANDRPDFPLLKIGDDPLDLGPAPSKTTRDVRVEDVERDAAAYGNVAQICIQLAAILDVRLRYPVCPSLSRSYICDFHQVKSKTNHRTPSGSSADAANRETLAKIEFPLFMDSPSDRTRYTYGVFLLNKNLEQLLNAHGLSAVGPRHTLQNLLRLFDARKHRLPDVSSRE